MAFTISPPNITATNPEAKIRQMQDWLYQLTEQLNICQNNIEYESLNDDAKNLIGKEVAKRIESGMTGQFEEVKSIIVKTADIARAEYDKLSTELHSDYVAQSEFGNYRESAQAQIEANALGITQNYNRTTELETNVNNVDASFTTYKQQTSAYIKTGYLYDEVVDGVSVPRYGLAIGESITSVDADGNEIYYKENQCATIIAGELAFWQNGTKIAYFNGQKLVVTSSIQIGDWLITNRNGLSVKYVGGDS